MYTAESLAEKFKYPFSNPAIRVMNNAEDEARRFNHNYLGTEHLLLGLTLDRVPPLESLGVDIDKVRTAVEFIIGRGETIVIRDIGLTPRAVKVIEFAVDEAQMLREKSLLPEYILFGLCKEGEGIAAGVLESSGVYPGRIQSQLRLSRLLGEPKAKAIDSLNRLRSYLLNPNQDPARIQRINMILDGTLGLISPETHQKES